MTKDVKALLELVRVGVTGECSFSEALYNADWKQLVELAAQHGLACVCMRGLEILHENRINICPTEQKLRLYAQSQQMAKAFAEKRRCCEEFIKEFAFPCVVLKGLDYCCYWPKPEWRSFGDLDIWLCGRYQEGNECAKELGCKIYVDYYKHSEFRYKGLMVENHQCFTMHDDTRSGKVLEKALRGLLHEDASRHERLSENLYSPSCDFTAIFLLVHAHQHFFFEGLSLKQILDWHFFLTKEEKNVNWEYVVAVLEEAGIRGFYDLMTELCVSYFGLNTRVAYRSDKALVERFVSEVFSGEVDGNKANHLIRRFKRIWRFRSFNGESLLVRIKNTLVYNKLHKQPTLE